MNQTVIPFTTVPSDTSEEPAIMTLKKISNRGLIKIIFSKEVVQIKNLTDFKINTQIIVKQSDQYEYLTSFTIQNMTDTLNLFI